MAIIARPADRTRPNQVLRQLRGEADQTPLSHRMMLMRPIFEEMPNGTQSPARALDDNLALRNYVNRLAELLGA
jgi:lysophospholipase L1-like esterase